MKEMHANRRVATAASRCRWPGWALELQAGTQAYTCSLQRATSRHAASDM